ncbi:MAG: phosphate ABC transporter substrate-binding protein [Dehalococcoidia bacterium]|nr:phosphate ABC transporter substrate-binding protein [Dehalococcoidia bacterium]
MNRFHAGRRVAVVLGAAAVLLAALAGCAPQDQPSGDGELSGSFNVIGSNTVTPLSTMWAEAFMARHQNVNIAISGPGSGAGIAALIDSTTDICQSSRLMKSSEMDQAKSKGVNPYEIVVASDGLAVVVNPANPVSQLTTAQLSAIYTGKVTNWKEVGGSDGPIVALARDTNSGTHVFFKEHVVQMDGLPTKDTSLEYGTDVLLLPSTEAGVIETANNVNAIFYAGLGYVSGDVKVLGVKKTDSDAAVTPSVETVLNGTYPVARPLLYYTNGEPTGVVKAFIDYCLSDEGQVIVVESGYVPLA